MSTALKPIRDIGPEFARKLDHELVHAAKGIDRRGRADRVQAECDRLRSLSDEEASRCRP